jgi:MFS family permease
MSRPWYRELTPYHWLVFIVASAAWFFDCMDQRLFSLARTPALESLMSGADAGAVQAAGKQVTAAFLVGWGIGGIIFGSLGDRLGRARMLTTTVLIYSVCTGLTYFSRGFWDFAISRFLTGLGIGGVFGLAVSLIATPDKTLPGTVAFFAPATGALLGSVAVGAVSVR